MSATSPFRSHLLQQWARNNQNRPPVAVVPWLKKKGGTSSTSQQQTQTQTQSHTQLRTQPQAHYYSQSHHRHHHHHRHPNDNRHRQGRETIQGSDRNESRRRSHHHHHRQTHNYDGTVSSADPIKSVDSSASVSSSVSYPSVPRWNFGGDDGDDDDTSAARSIERSNRRHNNNMIISPPNRHHHKPTSMSRRVHRDFSSSTSVASIPELVEKNDEDIEDSKVTTKDESKTLIGDGQKLRKNNDDPEDGGEFAATSGYSDSDDESSLTSMSSALQSLLLTRRTATRLAFQSQEDHSNGDDNMRNDNNKKNHHSNNDVVSIGMSRKEEMKFLQEALDRAVACAQMAPNHKRTEPFSFRRFFASSETAQQLAEITYQVTLAKTASKFTVDSDDDDDDDMINNKSNNNHNNNNGGGIANAEGKRQKWLQIPAFLVTLVHNNQSPVDIDNDDEATATTMSLPYVALPYEPPQTERQLEDVSF